jgi:helicase
MNVKDLSFPDEVKNILSTEAASFNPPQLAALKAGLLDKENMVVASPTASGKTLIAELAFLNHYLKNGKTVYLVPLKALASEKYEEFKQKYEKIGMKVAISTGDLDSGDGWLANYDLIIASNEKMDSILRHRTPWVKDISLIISDEVHLLDDASRGPTLEMVLTRLREEVNAQVLALSATISNANEIAQWLDAKLVKSDYRPVVLKKGVFLDNTLHFDGKETPINNEHEMEFSICKDTIDKKKQALIFVSTRRSAEAEADKIAKKLATPSAELEKIAMQIETALATPTKQCKRLANNVRKGVAFHHAGLVAKQRKLVEDNFRAGNIKFITATTSLAFGLNLPAWRVVVRDTKRYSGYGMDYIPNIEIQQMFGRAGRPKYDDSGEAILLAKTDSDKEEMEYRYINGDMEKIYSKLSVEPVLRMHVLALVASGFVQSKSQLRSFFEKTFYVHQYGDVDDVMQKIERVVKLLKDFKFITSDEKSSIEEFTPAFDMNADPEYKPTPLGKRVAELYIDPVSANHIIRNIGKVSGIDPLLTINQCTEMWPLLRIRAAEAEQLEDAMDDYGVQPPDAWDLDYDEFLKQFKTALMFMDWTNESSENQLLEKFNVTPGELYTKKNNAEWMLYSARELALLVGKKEFATQLNKLRLRIHYGVREDLIKLVMLKGIGRARSRVLFKAGIKRKADIKKTPPKALEKMLGKKTAQNILRQVS